MVIWKISCTFAASYPENNLFTLMETNTYWRFGAVVCEGHRFFLFIHLLHQIAYSIYYPKKKVYNWKVISLESEDLLTAVSRPVDYSEQACWLGSAELPTLVITLTKVSSWTKEVVSLNLRRHLLEPEKTYHWTREDISLNLRKYIIEPNKEHYTIHESLIW